MAGLPGDAPLTPRRLEVLRLAANGLTNGDIARALWLSEETVKSHLQLAYCALGARDRAHAVAIALVRGLIQPHEIQLRPPGMHRGLKDSAPTSRTGLPIPGPTAGHARPNAPSRHPSSIAPANAAHTPAQAVA